MASSFSFAISAAVFVPEFFVAVAGDAGTNVPVGAPVEVATGALPGATEVAETFFLLFLRTGAVHVEVSEAVETVVPV